MHVARRLTEETGGVYGVALSEAHLDELIMAHAPPPPALVRPTGADVACSSSVDMRVRAG